MLRRALCIRTPHIPSDDKRQWRTQHTFKLARTFRPTRPTTMTKSINIRGIRKYRIQIEYRLVIVIIGCECAPIVAAFAVVVRWNSLWSGVGRRAQKDSGSCHANNMQIVVWCMACNPFAYCNIDTWTRVRCEHTIVSLRRWIYSNAMALFAYLFQFALWPATTTTTNIEIILSIAFDTT